MVPGPLTLCAQCGAVIESDPVTLGDEVFCCLGCVGGGPCICDRDEQPQLTLRIGPFGSQAELLRFATRLEQAPGLIYVELIRPDAQDAAFNVIAPSARVLALAVEAIPDVTVTTQLTDTAVIARITASPRIRTPDAEDDLLPTRTRFRVFRTTESPAPEPAAPPRLPGPAEGAAPTLRRARRIVTPGSARPEEEVAALLVNTRASSTVQVPSPEPPETSEISAEAPVASSAGAAAPRSVLVVGGPFTSFAAVNGFQALVRSLPGVSGTSVRRLYNGTLQLMVDYEDDAPFAARLRAVAGGACTVTEARGQVEIRVTSPDAFTVAARA